MSNNEEKFKKFVDNMRVNNSNDRIKLVEILMNSKENIFDEKWLVNNILNEEDRKKYHRRKNLNKLL